MVEASMKPRLAPRLRAATLLLGFLALSGDARGDETSLRNWPCEDKFLPVDKRVKAPDWGNETPRAAVAWLLPTTKEHYENVYGKHSAFTAARESSFSSAKTALSEKRIEVASLGTGSLDAWRSYIARPEGPRILFIVGHNVDGRLRFLDGHDETLIALTKECYAAGKTCLFVTCEVGSYLQDNVAHVALRDEITPQQAAHFVVGVFERLEGARHAGTQVRADDVVGWYAAQVKGEKQPRREATVVAIVDEHSNRIIGFVLVATKARAPLGEACKKNDECTSGVCLHSVCASHS